MSEIYRVKFKTLVDISGTPQQYWDRGNAVSSAAAGKINARMGDPTRGERPGSIVLEHRLVPSDHYEVIVPEGNIAQIFVRAEPTLKQGAKK
jgi:hypothetical protein